MDPETILDDVAACLDVLDVAHERFWIEDRPILEIRHAGDSDAYVVAISARCHRRDGLAALNVFAYAPLTARQGKRIALATIPPDRLAQLHVLVNLANDRVRVGAFLVDQDDGDLAYRWVIPLAAAPTRDIVKWAMDSAQTIGDLIHAARAVVVDGKPAWQAFEEAINPAPARDVPPPEELDPEAFERMLGEMARGAGRGAGATDDPAAGKGGDDGPGLPYRRVV